MVLGNHDFHLLVCALTDRQPNKKDTFQDILNAVDGEYLSLELGDVLDPCILKISDRNNCKFVIMPMRLN